MIEKGYLGVNPVKFNKINYIGSLGLDWKETDYNLSKLLTQNVLYSAYHQDRTILEIANLFGVSTSIIKDELEFLEDNGFINKVSNEKYSTNMLIHDLTSDIYEKMHSIYYYYAEKVTDIYVPVLLDYLKSNNYFNDSIYTPENDLNYMLWAFILFTIDYKFNHSILRDDLTKYYVKRKNGSDNIAFTAIEKGFNLSFNKNLFYAASHIINLFSQQDKYSFSVWKYDTFYNERVAILNQSTSDYTYLYFYLSKKIKNEPAYDYIFQSLYDNGFLLNTENTQNLVNIVISTISANDLQNMLPQIPEYFINLNYELGNELFDISKSLYPERYHDLCKAFYQRAVSNSDMVTRMIKLLLNKGIIKPLSEKRKRTASLIMFCDVFPE